MTSGAVGPGSHLDRYELLAAVAGGGMGTVWRARLRGKHGFEKIVAIKTMRPELATDARFRRMFLDEARIASRIEHANVAQVIDLGEQDDVLYLVMEWVDGRSLEEVALAAEGRGETLPLGVVLRVLADTAAGLHVAHELCDERGVSLNLVHRDISPQNILVSDRGVAKLVDFGIAKARDRLAGETTVGRPKGKPSYMAPEQARGRLIDRRADVWGLGVVLFRLLAGAAPFRALDAFEDYADGKTALPELPQEVPEVVAQIVATALAPDVHARFESAAGMHHALGSAMSASGEALTTVDVALYLGGRTAMQARPPQVDEPTETRRERTAATSAGRRRARSDRGPLLLLTNRAHDDDLENALGALGYIVSVSDPSDVVRIDVARFRAIVTLEAAGGADALITLAREAEAANHPCLLVCFGETTHPLDAHRRFGIRVSSEREPEARARWLEALDREMDLGEGFRKLRS